ncbi:hypothetical protein J8TS2_27490 [Lederbergia ruris]|uniref:Uncharacterized protein n=1 Tax=Lederbergia ruris TaxID=217495 RepID=A0ABQ4KKE9_9BACI|nr:hypothetical protein [Lederbergia ruris]GIN58430.1 hypothetical protein J8TS2_27490 [Lederbergia ruris]
MPVKNYYHMCRKGIGRPVMIRTRDGHVHRGIISHVTPSKVYIRPFGRRYGGYGYGWGWGWGWGAFGLGIGLGAITALAFTPFFWY